MKVGDIFRKTLHNGTPIGGFLRVIKIEGGCVEARNLIGIQRKTTFYHKRYEVAKIKKMPITHPVWERINSGQQIAIIHDATPMWENMLKECPELVEIRDVTYPQKRMVFIVDQIGPWWDRRTRQIRLTLGTRIE